MKKSLPKKIILKKNKSFNKVFKKGDKFSSQFFMAYLIPSDSLHVGFAAQRGYKNKPQRNRLKRITRELWRLNYKEFNFSFDMVLVTKISVLNTEHDIFKNDFKILLNKIQHNSSSLNCEKNNIKTC